ncbi:MAG: TonB-dependent receptor [Bacteroidales bacterium]
MLPDRTLFRTYATLCAILIAFTVDVAEAKASAYETTRANAEAEASAHTTTGANAEVEDSADNIGAEADAQVPASARAAASSPGESERRDPTGAMAGTVVDPDGRPVAGAEVLLTNAASVAFRTRTDPEGRYELTHLPAGRYEVTVALEGFRADPRTVAVDGDEARGIDLRLHVAAVSESVVVSASQLDVPLSHVAESATVISRRDMTARQMETVADALRLVPGIEVAMNGGRGSVTSLFARGGESDYTLVLVDGVRSNAFGGGFDFSQLPSANIDRVEVVRGPGSALFGSDAIGAVVSVTTRQGGKPRVSASIEAGRLATRRLTASTSGSHGSWSWGGGAERISTDGFTGTAPASGERVSNDDYQANQATGTATWRAAGGTQVAFNGSWNKSDRGFPGPYGSNPIGAYPGVDRVSRGVVETREAASTVVAPLAHGRVRQHAQVTWFDLSSDFTSSYGLSASGTRRLSARSQTDVLLSDSTRLAAGIDVQHERAENDFITGTASAPVPIVRDLVGVFAEVRHQRGSRLTLAGGLRGESVRRDALDGSPNPYSPRPPFPADTARALNPKGSVAYLLHANGRAGGVRPSWIRLRGSGGTGMRAPDAIEIAFTDNPHLLPERSRSGEFGIESAFASGGAVVEATYFANRYDNLIVAVGPSMVNASQYKTDNIANARAQGVELSTRVRTGWGLEAHVAYTWLDTEVLAVDRAGVAPPPFHVGDPLLRRPRSLGSVDLLLARGRFTAYSQVGARGRTLDIEPNYGAYGGLFWNPGYATVRCGAAWRIAPALEVFGRVDNLFDRRYEETFGFPALGRTAMAGVRIAASR